MFPIGALVTFYRRGIGFPIRVSDATISSYRSLNSVSLKKRLYESASQCT